MPHSNGHACCKWMWKLTLADSSITNTPRWCHSAIASWVEKFVQVMKVSIIVSDSEKLSSWLVWWWSKLNNWKIIASHFQHPVYWLVLLLWTGLRAWPWTNQMGCITQHGFPGTDGDINSWHLCYNYFCSRGSSVRLLNRWGKSAFVWKIRTAAK